MIFIYLTLAVSAFFIGYNFALNRKAKLQFNRKKGVTAIDENLQREYENFLSYDGSEQQ